MLGTQFATASYLPQRRIFRRRLMARRRRISLLIVALAGVVAGLTLFGPIIDVL